MQMAGSSGCGSCPAPPILLKSSDLGEFASEYSELAGAGHLELLLLTYLHLQVPVVFLPHVEHDARLPLYVSDAVQVRVKDISSLAGM
jgi:hypothetical protein